MCCTNSHLVYSFFVVGANTGPCFRHQVRLELGVSRLGASLLITGLLVLILSGLLLNLRQERAGKWWLVHVGWVVRLHKDFAAFCWSWFHYSDRLFGLRLWRFSVEITRWRRCLFIWVSLRFGLWVGHCLGERLFDWQIFGQWSRVCYSCSLLHLVLCWFLNFHTSWYNFADGWFDRLQ